MALALAGASVIKSKGGERMGRIEKTIEIEAPVEKVFAYVIDHENFVNNQPPDMEFKLLRKDDGPQRVGFTATVRAKVGGNVLEVEDETTELVKNKKYSGRQNGGSFKKFSHTELFEPTEHGTKYTTIIEYELPYSLLGKIIDKLKVHKEMEKSFDYSMKQTKKDLE